MSEDRLHDASGSRDSWLNASFEQWDAGTPEDHWNELDESLSVEKVWQRIDQSIPAAEHAQDNWISESHESWEPEMGTDGWERLNEAVSLEHVWQELDSTLSKPVVTRLPFMKLLAATVAMLFAVSSLNDYPVETTGPTTRSANEMTALITTGDRSGNGQPASDAEILNPSENTAGVPAPTNAGQPANRTIALQQVQQPDNNPAPQNRQEVIVQNTPVPIIAEQQEPEIATVNPVEEAANVDPLTRKAPDNTLYPLIAGNWKPRQRFSPWTIQMGTQLSILQETDQSRLTSVVPQFGMAADLSFRHRIGPVQLIHAVGLSQYSQDAGKYMNGRYLNMKQRINTLQWSSSVGYNSGRFTFYGGVLLSKMLNGLEQNQSKITKVYNFTTIQLGATGGVDLRLVSFPQSGKNISVGAQYQWIPNLAGKSQSFENIHGIRLQAKFSF